MPIARLSVAQPISRSDSSIVVDRAAGTIYGVSLMAVGAAQGWPFTLDNESVDKFVQLSKDAGTLRTRWKHPETDTDYTATGEAQITIGDDLGSVIGKVVNIRRIADRARGDLILGEYAKNLPDGVGNVWDYILDLAESDPELFGMSAVFAYSLQQTNPNSLPAARIESVDAADVVGKPAANPNGLLSQGSLFDPQPGTPPPSDPNASGWADDDPRNWATAPLPVETADSCLSQMCQAGTLTLADLAANMDPTTASCRDPFIMMRGKLNRFVSAGLATCDDGANYRPTPAAYARNQQSGYGAMAARPGDQVLDSAKRQKAMEDAGHLLMRHLLDSDSSAIPIPSPNPGVDVEREQQLSQDGMPPAAPGAAPFPVEDLNQHRNNMLKAAGFAARKIALNQEISDAGILPMHIDKAKNMLLSRPGKLYEIADRFMTGEPVNLTEDDPDDEGAESDLAARPQTATASAKSIVPASAEQSTARYEQGVRVPDVYDRPAERREQGFLTGQG
jgi:hypothetical protein